MLRRPHKRLGKKDTPVKESKKTKKEEAQILGESLSKDDGELMLEKFVLGAEEEILQSITTDIQTKKKKKEKIEKKPAWQDDDDEQVSVKVPKPSGRSKFEKLVGDTSWAKLKWQKESEDEDSDTETRDLLRSTGDYIDSSESLPKGLVQLKKCTDANKEYPSQGKLKSVEFHPTAQVLLAAGMDHRLNIFQVDGKDNPKIQSVFVERFPIHTAHFSQDGTEVVMGSRYPSFYYYDMIAGKMIKVPHIKGLEEHNMKKFAMSPDGRFIVFLGSYGKMHLISAKSKEWVDTIKMNGNVECVAFNKDGSKMYSHGDDGEVYIWDINSRQCIHRFIDDGCNEGTSIAVSKDNRYLAAGSYSGVVNIYETSTCDTKKIPKPVKSVMNLTTPCTSCVFNSTSEILAIGSNYTESAVKLVHFPSQTVFSNFPEKTDALRIPFSIDFSLNSGYFCVGNHRGEAKLYRVQHYGSY